MPKTKRYPGHIEQRGGSFRVELSVAGERHRYALKDVSRREAEAFAKRKGDELAEAARRRTLGLPDPLACSGLLKKYEAERLPLLAPKTRATYASSIRIFRRYFVDELGDPAVDAIQPAHLTQYATWRRTHPAKGTGTVSARTVAKDLVLLHSLFAFAIELGMRPDNPASKERVKRPKVTTRDPVLLKDGELERLLAECRDHDMLRLYVLLLAETGARAVSEALRLKWSDVDLEGGFVRITSDRTHRTKSGKGRWVPMTPRLRAAMREHFARYRLAVYDGRRAEYVFHHVRSRRTATAGARIRDIRASFASAIRRAKLPDGFRPHDLRHRRVTTWLAAGKDVTHVKEAMGHASLQTTMGYTHLAREHLRSLVDQDDGDEKAAARKLAE